MTEQTVVRTTSEVVPHSTRSAIFWLGFALLALALVGLCAVGAYLFAESYPTTATTTASLQRQISPAQAELRGELPPPVVTDVPATATPVATSVHYPLTGLEYQACIWEDQTCTGWQSAGDLADVYNAEWTEDGRLWQPSLPPPAARTHAFDISIQLVEGQYAFNGVVCTLRDATGLVVSHRENMSESGKSFSVLVADKTLAPGETVPTGDFKISCGAAFNSGFEILWLHK